MGQLDYKHPSRIYQAEDEQWYFSARNQQAIGPFLAADEAERALRRHISDCKVRNSLAMSISWPRRWSPMRLARRSQKKHTKETSFVAH